MAGETNPRKPRFRTVVMLELIFETDAPTLEASMDAIAPTLAKFVREPFAFGPRGPDDPLLSLRTNLPNPVMAITTELEPLPAGNVPGPKEVQ